MKTLKTIFAIAILSILTSCSKTVDEPEVAKGGNITFTIDGVTTKITDGVFVGIAGNNIEGVSDKGVKTYIGDPAQRTFVVGTALTNVVIQVHLGLDIWDDRSNDNKLTVTFNDGKTVKGTFSGKVKRYIAGTDVYKNITGTFETTDLVAN